MEGETQAKGGKKGRSHRGRGNEAPEFDGEITLQLDEFYRHFNYYYPGKNKEEIISNSFPIQTNA
jgi:hypothetical protein